MKFFLAVFLMLSFILCGARGDILISEMQAAPNGQLIGRTPEGVSHAGWGPVWQSAAFTAEGWGVGTAPFGTAITGGAAVGTDVPLALMTTPTLYIRQAITLTAEQAGLAEALLVKVRYDDGFVLWINGREVTRANLGPPGQHVYHHQVPYRAGIAQVSPPQPALLEMSPGPVRDWLKAGENVVAAVVSNRNLGSERGAGYAINNACFLDVSLAVIPTRVDRTLATVDFAESNGASRQFRRLTTGLQETATGTPPAGSWLATAAVPVIPSVNTGLSVTAEALAGIGGGGPGAMRWTVSQTGAGVQSAEFRGGVLKMGSTFPGALTEEDLNRLSLTFRRRLSSSAGSGPASFGFRLEAPGGTALGEFPVIAESAGAGETLSEYGNFFGGSRTLNVPATGTPFISSTGLLRGNPLLSTGPALRDAAFRVTEDSSAGAGYGGTAGVLKIEMTRAAAVADEVRVTYAGLNASGLTAGEITADDLINTGLTVAVKAPAGRAVRIFLVPDHAQATLEDQWDFGSVTGTGAWQVVEFPLAAAVAADAARTRLNALRTTAFRVGVGLAGSLPVGQPVWLDRAGMVTLWTNYRADFSNASASSKSAFLAAYNASADRGITPVFTKLSNPAPSATHSLTIDDVVLSYRESGGIAEAILPEAAPGWRYFPGFCEPTGGLADPGSFDEPGYDGDWDDWIELHNNGTTPQDLTGWHITDDVDDPARWPIPAGVTIFPGQYLVIIADGKPQPSGARYLHANFKLASEGGDLILRNAEGAVVSAMLDYPKQDGFHTWGLGTGENGYGYLTEGSPGAANRGLFLPEHCDKPDFDVEPGYHQQAVTLTMTSDTPGCEIRFTSDGAEPTDGSPLYTAPLVLGNAGKGKGHCLRARAFKAGAHASNIRTATYLIGQDARLRTASAVCLSGGRETTFFKPYGITAIVGGSRPDGLWKADGIGDYNNALGDLNNQLLTGQAWERPVTFELLAEGRAGVVEDIGIRISGSPFSRPRYELDNIGTLPWSYTNLFEKPSFNLWWRNEYGKDQLEYPVFGEGYPVERFKHLRMRGGHNDLPNPYVKDEYVRRLYLAMGRVGSRGTFNPLFVNAEFAGIYNMCERVREPFMQEHFGSDNKWDVIQRGEIGDGDEIAFKQMLTKIDQHAGLPTAANYAAVEEWVDVESLIDYLLLYTWAGTGDWPHNNWIASRERTLAGRWRWFPWDAEGAFGGFSKTLGYNVLTQDLQVDIGGANRELCRVYSSLIKNPEFRLKFADAVNLHLCNGGALTDARLTALKNTVVEEYRPLLAYILSAVVNESFFTSWVSNTATDKRDVLFRSAVLTVGSAAAEYGYQLPLSGLWPALEGKGNWQAPLPPLLDPPGGTVAEGLQLTMRHTVTATDRTVDNPYRAGDNQAPLNRAIYFTTDGTDPRLRGGSVSPAAQIYAGPLTLTAGPVAVLARIRNTSNNEWSPLARTTFRSAAVPPSADNLVVAEIMYHPPDVIAGEIGYTDQDDFEFVRLLNVGNAPVDLRQARFTVGIDFNFETGTLATLDPGDSALVVSNAEAFRLRYGAAAAARVAGQYIGNLSNGGEGLRLEDSGGKVIREFVYDDTAPWPAAADGAGASLLLRQPRSLPDHAVAGNWMASTVPGGLGTLPVSLTYAKWSQFLGFPNLTAAGDADGDGLCNLMEYALGSDPFSAGSVEFQPEWMEESGGRFLGISYCTMAAAGDVDVTVEVGDGVSWTSGSGTVVPVGEPELLPDGRWRHRWRDTMLVGQTNRRFLRLRAAMR